MKPLASQIEEQCENLKFAQDNISVKDGILPPTDVISTQLQQPLLQFSGACAGCGETPNVKLLTQLFGDRLIIANATGCSSIWGGYAPASPYCKNQHGRGPAWGNSLFEDNAEYGYGIMKGILARRTRLINMAKVAVSRKDTPTDVAVLLDAWIAVKGDPDQSLAAGEDAAAAIKKYLQLGDFSAAKAADVGDNSYGIALGVDGDEASKTAPAAANEGDTFYTFPINNLLREIYDARDMFQKKSVWAIGGDGWAFDIDYDGLDAVLASGEDINMLVLDTEGYSNTGGEMSKATQLGSVSTFSLAGKDTPKKRLARMCIQYDYVYVAQVCFGADMNQIITALREAEAYPGPSIVIALCPCISWGLKSGMGAAVGACRDAVRTGYWTLWRYNPTLAAAGQNPLTIDSKPPQGEAALRKFLMGQNRFASLAAKNPERSSMLQSELAKERATNRGELDAMQDVYALKNKAKS
jgi:pyruvate-ferredoxin/flavodoxin oxidoreductase